MFGCLYPVAFRMGARRVAIGWRVCASADTRLSPGIIRISARRNELPPYLELAVSMFERVAYFSAPFPAGLLEIVALQLIHVPGWGSLPGVR